MNADGDGRVARAYRVVGRVQGVGFRWWTYGVAEELGIGGTVRNLQDGSVEVWACGRAHELDELERRLRRGPAFARVDELDQLGPPDVEQPEGFRIVT